jgi:predicted AAA+ superfamily ATPase
MIAKIESWMRMKTRQGLLVTGARQVGKVTYLPIYMAGLL